MDTINKEVKKIFLLSILILIIGTTLTYSLTKIVNNNFKNTNNQISLIYKSE